MAKTAMIQAQQKWEYEVISRKSETYLARELNSFGETGWDVATIIYGKDRKGEPAWHAFLKRPYTGPPRKVSMDAGSAGSTPEETEGKKADPTAGLTGFDLDDGDFKIAEPEPEAEAEAKGAALGPSVAVPTLSTSAEKATCGNLRFLNPSLAAVQGPLGIPATSSHCSVMPKWGLKKARRP